VKLSAPLRLTSKGPGRISDQNETVPKTVLRVYERLAPLRFLWRAPSPRTGMLLAIVRIAIRKWVLLASVTLEIPEPVQGFPNECMRTVP
jgi:hypothetical protein